MTPKTVTLSEERRKQLDGIVAEMEKNNEPEDNIRLVVEDFKTKYSGEDGAKKKYTLRKRIGLWLIAIGNCLAEESKDSCYGRFYIRIGRWRIGAVKH